MEAQLLEALVALETAAGPHRPAGAPVPDVRPLLAELDRLTRTLPADADPELVHYLRQRSYSKARLYLEDRRDEIQRGGCRRLAS
ncbi:MAG: hypothetical protein JNL10_17285 [Verrucomicrobiales bacterium]|nr:hypothetical protein [Verrucomicrobiales bacterium]